MHNIDIETMKKNGKKRKISSMKQNERIYNQRTTHSLNKFTFFYNNTLNISLGMALFNMQPFGKRLTQ